MALFYIPEVENGTLDFGNGPRTVTNHIFETTDPVEVSVSGTAYRTVEAPLATEAPPLTPAVPSASPQGYAPDTATAAGGTVVTDAIVAAFNLLDAKAKSINPGAAAMLEKAASTVTPSEAANAAFSFIESHTPMNNQTPATQAPVASQAPSQTVTTGATPSSQSSVPVVADGSSANTPLNPGEKGKLLAGLRPANQAPTVQQSSGDVDAVPTPTPDSPMLAPGVVHFHNQQVGHTDGDSQVGQIAPPDHIVQQYVDGEVAIGTPAPSQEHFMRMQGIDPHDVLPPTTNTR